MSYRVSRAVAASCLLALASACSKSYEAVGGIPANPLRVSASLPTVLANGVNTVTIHFEGAASSPVSVTTTRGTFVGGLRTTSIAATSGDVTLTTCNAAVDPACAGVAKVTASEPSTGSASVNVTFGGFELCAGDCAFDPACQGRACTLAAGAPGTCSSTTPSVCIPPVCTPTAAGPETACADDVDNDCNGNRDCADTNCAGQPCRTGSPTFICQSGACTDVASGSAIAVTPGRTRLPANGAATTPVVIKVTKNAQGQAGVDVTLSASLGALSATTTRTAADGTATVTFTASAAPGVASITASLTAVPLVAQSATVTMPALGSVQVGSVQFPVMGVRGSGYREIDPIVISVLDDQGKPYPDGLAVRFEHNQLGGSLLSAPLSPDTATCLASAGCIGFEGATASPVGSQDTAGLAQVNLHSGTVAGTLSVLVTAAAGGITRTFTVPNVAVIGAKANGANLSVVCSPRNVPAFAETNCSTSQVDASFTCEALLKDRFNNVLGTQTQVTFKSEAAAVGQVAVTPAYDPARDPTQQPNLGIARQIFNTLGAGLPFDVPPAAGEPSVTHGLDGCGIRTHNPRDGVVTIIAIADGEEAFFDANGNGIYDAGEPFIDLGEPYVDEDDNGRYDAGEWFLDVNQNGVYDGPNGRWDANGKIWTETVVVYTGTPATLAATGTTFLGTRWVDQTFVSACTPSAAPPPFSVNAPVPGPPPIPATAASLFVVASDMNLNRLAGTTTYSVAVETPGKVSASYKGLASYADDAGFFFQYWPCDQAGSCASQCRAAGANLPCLMRPAITGYSCGIAASTVVTGAAPADGTNLVDWNVATTYPVLGGSKTAIHVERVSGTNN